MTCKDCIHHEACIGNDFKQTIYEYCKNDNVELLCENFKDCSKFIELKTARLIKHKPDMSKMREFHKLGIGKAMGERSIFCTCSNCEMWCSLAYDYCPNCGAKIVREAEQALRERKNETR